MPSVKGSKCRLLAYLRSTLKHSSLTSVKVKYWKIPVGQGVKVPPPHIFAPPSPPNFRSACAAALLSPAAHNVCETLRDGWAIPYSPAPYPLDSVGRWGLLRLVQRISGDDTGAPSRGVVILCLLLTLVCAWVTDFIGIDAIFGAFVAGIIVPREHRSGRYYARRGA